MKSYCQVSRKALRDYNFAMRKIFNRDAGRPPRTPKEEPTVYEHYRNFRDRLGFPDLSRTN